MGEFCINSAGAVRICARHRAAAAMKRLFTKEFNGQSSANVGRAVFLAGAGAALGLSMMNHANDDVMHAPAFPWPNSKPWQAFDHASIRRGWTVYKEVCAACHSLEFVAYRNLVGNVLTEEEAKAEAADIDVVDGPDKDGEMYDRPGKLTDFIPRPYANDEAGRSANNNALPPDLSVMIKARHGGPDYIFALLTGYRNPPAGVTVSEPLYYNPYFPGGAIAMAQALTDDMIEYDDGTPATIGQMAKDVSHFLAWTAEPEHDERKQFGMKNFIVAGVMAVASLYWKRQKWAPQKSRKIKFF